MQDVLENNTSAEVKEEMDIKDLMKFTPELENYIKASIYTTFGKPDKVFHERLSIYDGWDKGNVQRGRFCIFHKIPNPKALEDFEVSEITSYFLRISPINVCIYKQSTVGEEPDLTISYPTKG